MVHLMKVYRVGTEEEIVQARYGEGFHLLLFLYGCEPLLVRDDDGRSLDGLAVRVYSLAGHELADMLQHEMGLPGEVPRRIDVGVHRTVLESRTAVVDASAPVAGAAHKTPLAPVAVPVGRLACQAHKTKQFLPEVRSFSFQPRGDFPAVLPGDTVVREEGFHRRRELGDLVHPDALRVDGKVAYILHSFSEGLDGPVLAAQRQRAFRGNLPVIELDHEVTAPRVEPEGLHLVRQSLAFGDGGVSGVEPVHEARQRVGCGDVGRVDEQDDAVLREGRSLVLGLAGVGELQGLLRVVPVVLVREQRQAVHEVPLELFVDIDLKGAPAVFEVGVEPFQGNDAAVLAHDGGYLADGAGQVTGLDVLDVTDSHPVAAVVLTLLLALGYLAAVVEAVEDIEAALLDDAPVGGREGDAQQVPFAAVDAEDIHAGVLPNDVPHACVDLPGSVSVGGGVDEDGHMEGEAVLRVTAVLDEVVREGAALFGVVGVLVGDGDAGGMGDVPGEAGLAVVDGPAAAQAHR